MSLDAKPLETFVSGGIARIVLDRPPVNALDQGLKEALLESFRSLVPRSEVRVLVISSASPTVFCAGSDLKELVHDHGMEGSALQRTLYEFHLWETLSRLPQPSIAAIEGHSLGSGTEMVIACDFRVAGRGASIGLPEIRIGGAPGIQSVARLVSMVGLPVARRLLLFGEAVSAEKAAVLGLVDEVVDTGHALDRALELAEQLAGQPRSSVAFLKGALAESLGPAVDRVHDWQAAQVSGLFTAPEMDEGIIAFLQKRPADFRRAEPQRHE